MSKILPILRKDGGNFITYGAICQSGADALGVKKKTVPAAHANGNDSCGEVRPRHSGFATEPSVSTMIFPSMRP
jgi:hypothetical protein